MYFFSFSLSHLLFPLQLNQRLEGGEKERKTKDPVLEFSHLPLAPSPMDYEDDTSLMSWGILPYFTFSGILLLLEDFTEFFVKLFKSYVLFISLCSIVCRQISTFATYIDCNTHMLELISTILTGPSSLHLFFYIYIFY